jgi:hypothetical protein
MFNKKNIECTFTPMNMDKHIEDVSIWIPFLDWQIEVSVSSKDKDFEYIRIHGYTETEDGLFDCTDDFLQYHTDNDKCFVNPTGANLYQAMDMLRTVYKLQTKGGK